MLAETKATTAFRTTFAFIAQVSTYVISLVSGVLVARMLGPDGKGVLSVLLLTAGASQAFAQWGIQESILPLLRENRALAKSVSGSALLLGVLLSMVVVCVVVAIYPLLVSSVFRGITSIQLVGVMVSVPITVAGLTCGRMVQLDSSIRYSTAQIISACLAMVGYVLAFWIWPYDLKAGIAGYFLLQLVTLAVYLASGIQSGLIGMSVRSKLVKSLFLGGSTMQVGLLATVLATQVGILALNTFSNSSEVGLFATAISVTGLLAFFPVAIRIVLQKRLVDINSRSDWGCVVTQMTRHAVLWLLVGSAGIILFGRWLIALLYGDAFSGVYPIAMIILPGTTCLGVAQLIASFFVIDRQFAFTSLAAVVGLSVNLVLLVAFRHSLNGMTAAIAQTLASLVWASMYFVRFAKTTSTPPGSLMPGRAEFSYYGNLVYSLSCRLCEGLRDA